MNTKYAVALILALQVSVSLCELPTPSEELVTKYDELKNTFYSRLLTFYRKMQAQLGPVMERASESERAQAVKDFAESLQTKPEFQAVVKVATGLAQEAAPLVDKARTSALGAYEHYLRGKVGQQLSDAIDMIKPILDQYLPVE